VAENPLDEEINRLFQPADTVLDSDGHKYPTCMIGEQTWLGQNLRVESCNASDGMEMSWGDGLEKGPGVSFYSQKPLYGYYLGKSSLGYGTLYTYAAVKQCNLCPEGFRVATKADWETLIEAIGPESDRSKKLFSSYGSPFHAGLGGRVDSYGSVLGGRLEFWWTGGSPGSPQTLYYKVWAAELGRNGEVRIKKQDVRAANYVRCVKN
jgi:uncharacterized protein (TIGR02145 family)